MSEDNGNTWELLHTGGEIKITAPSDYSTVFPIAGTWKIGAAYDTIAFDIDENDNLHMCQIIYYTTSTSAEAGYMAIKYFINDEVVLEKTIYTQLLTVNALSTTIKDGIEYRAVEGQLHVKNGVAKFYLLPDKRVVSSGSSIWTTDLHIINFSVSNSSATYVNTEMYTLGLSNTGAVSNRFFIVHEKTNELGVYYIGAVSLNRVSLIRYDGSSATVITTQTTSSGNPYDVVVTDNYMAYTKYYHDRPVVYKIKDDEWVNAPIYPFYMESHTSTILINIIGTKLYIYCDSSYYEEEDDGIGTILASYWDIETENAFWYKVSDNQNWHIPPGNSRVGYAIPDPNVAEEVLVTSITDGRNHELVGVRLVGDYYGDITGGPADIMYIQVSFIGSAEIGPNQQGALKTNNKYGTS
jgi:hypothetical protein